MAALFVVGVAVTFTAACGGSGNADTNTNTDTAPNQNGGGNSAFTAYAECLQQNGVTLTMPSGRPSGFASRRPEGERPSGVPRPDGSGFPGGGGRPGGFGMQKPDGVDDATWEKAQTACASLRPTGRGGPGGPGGNGNNAAFQNCLKDHGVTATAGPPDTADETTRKAVEACRVLQQPQTSPSPAA